MKSDRGKVRKVRRKEDKEERGNATRHQEIERGKMGKEEEEES